MSIMIPANALDRRLTDLGLLLGILRTNDGGVELSFNTEWFSNPLPYLKQIPNDTDNLLDLLRAVLGTPAADMPDPTGQIWEWYGIDWNGASSGAYIVLMQSGTTAPWTIGVALWHPYTGDEAIIAIASWFFVPLFNLPVGTPVIITGSSGYPVQLRLDINDTKETFTAGSGSSAVAFTGIEFQGNIYFSDTEPNFTLDFLNLTPPSSQSTVATLAGLQNVNFWINAVLGNATVDGWLSTTIPSTGKAIGAVLVDLQLLQLNGTQYALGGLSAFENQTPAGIAEMLLAEALQALASNQTPFVALGSGGIYFVSEPVGDPPDQVTDYGLRLQIADIALSGASNTARANAIEANTTRVIVPVVVNDPQTPPDSGSETQFLLQLGKWLTGDTDADNWGSRAGAPDGIGEPGITILLVRVDEKNDDQFSFHPQVELVSLGFDFKGGGANPLIDVDGFGLGGVEPRFYLSLDFSDLQSIPWGGAMRLDQLAVPLGAGVPGSAGSDNPVAQNLLSSGGDSGGGGDNAAVNPAFSVAAAWVSTTTNNPPLNVQLYGADDKPVDLIWIPIQRGFGPLHCQRLGVNWQQPPSADLLLSLLFDGYVTLGPLEIDLISLSVGIPLRTPGVIDNYKLDLKGLAVSYASGPISISGGILKNTDVSPIEYDGEMTIQAAAWSLSALGSYASLNGHPSLFVFARLGAPIGGPPFFFVTGLCAGFGYNRSLRVPGQDEVADFPLLAGIADASQIGGENASPAQALAKLTEWIQPAQGVNWFAAGVQFTSFELIQSNVVLVAIVTGDFEIAILGLSRMKLPQAGPVQFAYVELALEIVLHPSAGFFGVSAVITPNSYVIDPACHLTGGFAFYLWFAAPADGSTDHKGDFVVTLGGYHPAFDKPAWYPDEPRLGFSWQVSDLITMQGGAYFAITPSCVMAGGSLDIEFHSGNLRAWFTAHANFLFHWKPYYFSGSVGVSIGASYKMDLSFCSVTITVELGADLEIYGPPVAGSVSIDWYIISFTIPFGPSSTRPPAVIQWDDFSQLLPQPDTQTQATQSTLAAFATSSTVERAHNGDDPLPSSNVCKLIVNDGLIRLSGDKETAGGKRWIVRADTFCFTIQTAFPLTEVDTGMGQSIVLYPQHGDPLPVVAVRPMGIASSDLTSKLSVNIDNEIDLTTWTWAANLGAVPAALWGEPTTDQPSAPTADTLPNRLLGLNNFKPPQSQPYAPPPIPLDNLAYDSLDENDSYYLPLSASEAATTPDLTLDADSLQIIADTIADDSVTQLRNAVFAALASYGYDAGANSTTVDIRNNVNLDYPSAPLLGAPWGTSDGGLA